MKIENEGSQWPVDSAYRFLIRHSPEAIRDSDAGKWVDVNQFYW